MFFSLLVVLLLWLLGGLGGLHLFYAGRRSEGFLWLGSAGVFGLGFITDALRIGALAREASGAAPEAPGKKDDDAKASGDGPAVPLGKVAFQFILANWYWLVATLALRLVCYYGGLTEGLDETTFEMIKVLAGSAVAATVIVLLQYTDMRACSVKGVFGATCGLATTLLALKLSGNIEQASTQGPIMTGILVSRATSRWSKRKNAHKDVISPVMALAIVGLVVMSTGFVAYNAYNAALNYPISINDGEPLTIRQMMRESGTSNPFEFIKIVMVRLLMRVLTVAPRARTTAQPLRSVPVEGLCRCSPHSPLRHRD